MPGLINISFQRIEFLFSNNKIGSKSKLGVDRLKKKDKIKIKRRTFLKVSAAGICHTFLGNIFFSCASQRNLPNIILCMADDQGWGDMGYNGHPVLKTPNFDAMAVTALRFDRFYAAAPVCSPTRGSVMTGRHPNRFGCFRWGYSLRPQEITIAEALKKAGYITGHFGKWHLGSVCKGSPVNPGASGFDEWLSAPNFFDNDPILSREGTAIPIEGESSMVTVDAAIKFIRQQSQQAHPFLAVVWFGSPHRPHSALEQYRSLYSKEPENFQHFYGEITAMDRAFGKMRKELRTLGIYENTILWYCSDNGGLPEVGSTGGRGHKGQLYEGGLRVPALLEWPAGIPEPFISTVPCNTSDIYPTLLDIAGVTIEKQPPLDGISLLPLMNGKMKTRSKAMGFWYYPAKGIPTPSKPWMSELLQAQEAGREIADSSRLRMDAADISRQYPENSFPGHSAWLDWPWKLHRIQHETGTIAWELYNLTDDPEESIDLINDNIKRVENLRPELENWLASVVKSLNGIDYQ